MCAYYVFYICLGTDFDVWVSKNNLTISSNSYTPPLSKVFNYPQTKKATQENLWCVSWQAVGFVRENHYIHSLQLTAKNPENRPFAPKGSWIVSQSHPFSGANCSFQGGYVRLLALTHPGTKTRRFSLSSFPSFKRRLSMRSCNSCCGVFLRRQKRAQMEKTLGTVDGRNPAPPGMYKTL